MNFVFISPHFPSHYVNFADRLKKMGVNVLGIADSSYDSLTPELKNALFALIENFPSYVLRFNKLVGSLNERFGFSLPEFSASLPSSL